MSNYDSECHFRRYYVKYLLDWKVKLLVLCMFISYIGLSIWGLANMEQGLDYEKLLIKTDPLVRTLKVEIELFHGGDQVFSRPQNLQN